MSAIALCMQPSVSDMSAGRGLQTIDGWVMPSLHYGNFAPPLAAFCTLDQCHVWAVVPYGADAMRVMLTGELVAAHDLTHSHIAHTHHACMYAHTHRLILTCSLLPGIVGWPRRCQQIAMTCCRRSRGGHPCCRSHCCSWLFPAAQKQSEGSRRCRHHARWGAPIPATASEHPKPVYKK